MYNKIYCSQVGKNPEHRLPEKHGNYITNWGEKYYEDTLWYSLIHNKPSSICTPHPEWFFEKVKLPEDVKTEMIKIIKENNFYLGEQTDNTALNIFNYLFESGYISSGVEKEVIVSKEGIEQSEGFAICPNCQTMHIQEYHSFCPSCGSKIIWK